jgi:hypothetical protein
MEDLSPPPFGEWAWHKDDASGLWKKQQEFVVSSQGKLNQLIEQWSLHPELDAQTSFVILLIYYIYDGYPWSQPEETRGIAVSCLEKILTPEHRNVSVCMDIIHRLLKPVFSTSSHPGVSAAGRRANLTPQVKKFIKEKEKPWRQHQHVIALLEFVVKNLDPKELETQWHLIVPATLNIVDDYDTAIKAKGCEILQALVFKISPKFLAQTGLGPVLWEACVPILSFVPPGTSLEDTLLVFPKGVNCMLSIAEKETVSSTRNRLLDELLRDGILKSIAHSNQKVNLLVVLISLLEQIVVGMGTHSIAHLPSLVQVYASIMRDPFLDLAPQLALGACHALNLIMKYCWPRIQNYRYDILLSSIVAWKRLGESDSPTAKDAKVSIRATISMLGDIVGRDVFSKDTERLLEKKPELAAMFIRA